MKNLLPDSIAAQAMALMIVGLAVSHLVSILFYSTDRESALLSAGGGSAIHWVATTGSFADTLTSAEWTNVAKAASSDDRFITITNDPVVKESSGTDWREIALQRELSRNVRPQSLQNYRISYAPYQADTVANNYWHQYLLDNGRDTPDEMILISLRLSSGKWLNVATPIQTVPGFLSLRLGLSMAVMLIAVALLSAMIVRRMTGPLEQLSRAAEKLGTNVQAPAIAETGPEEVRRTARAFNVMQSRIRSFVEDRTQMLGAITHDLGTPITRMRLRAEFLQDGELRAKMLRDLDDMEHMVASTLAFIREDATQEPRARVDLGSLLSRVCDDITDAGEQVELAEIPRWVLLDCRPIALRRALGNLIGNAVKYGSKAKVSLRSEQECLLILIDDDGPGIPIERHEDVFQPFQRLEDSRNRETGGTGLGLAVARTIVHAHGGEIQLSNRPEGGLRVTISLPHPDQAPQKTTAENPDQTSKNRSGPARMKNFVTDKKSTNRSALFKTTQLNVHATETGRGQDIEAGAQAYLSNERTTEWKTH